jgi:hypothetical protein
MGGNPMNRKTLLSNLVLFLMVGLLLIPCIASANTGDSISFTAPRSTDVVVVGAPVTVSWTWNGDPGPLNFYLVDSDNVVKDFIATDIRKITASNFRYTVKVQDNYNWYIRHKIVARTVTGNKFVAESGRFAIKAPEIKVTLPTAGFVWPAGSLSTIKWTSETATGTAKIELVRDNQVVQVINPSLPIAQGSIAWTLPKTLPATYDDKDFVIRVWNVTVGSWGDSAPFKLDLTPAAAEPHLSGASMVFTTTSENKDAVTAVTVSVYNGANKKLAWGGETGVTYAANTNHLLALTTDPTGKKSDFTGGRVTIDAKAAGNDLWTFNGLLTLSFSDGTKIVKQSSYERVMNSQNSQNVQVDLAGPAMAKPAATTTQTPPPAQTSSGKITALLTHPATSTSPSYGYNYYSGSCPYPGNMNAKITSVKNASNSSFKLWFTDRLSKKSSEVTLVPGASTAIFNGMSAWGGLWEAAMTMPLPSSAALEVSWSAP